MNVILIAVISFVVTRDVVDLQTLVSKQVHSKVSFVR